MHNTDFYTLGKGIPYFSRKNSDGSYQGHRDLGNCPAFSTSLSLDVLEHYSSRSGMKAKDLKLVQTATPMVKFTLDEPNMENIALLNMGSVTAVSQSAGYAYTEDFAVKAQDVYYANLYDGKRAWLPTNYIKYNTGTGAFTVGGTLTGGTSNATATIQAIIGTTTAGILVLSAITGTFQTAETITDNSTGSATSDGAVVNTGTGDVLVCKSDGSVIYTKTTDYTLDTTIGRVYIVSGGDIESGTTITVAADYDAVNYSRISIIENTTLEGELHFISDNAIGENIELVYWRVSLTPSGDYALIGDNFSTLAFDGEILIDTANHPDLPYGQVIGDVETVTTTT